MKWLALIACAMSAGGTGYVRFGRSTAAAAPVWIDLAFLVSCAVGVAMVVSLVYARVTRVTRRELLTRAMSVQDDPTDGEADHR
jgi:hypothetical protein